MKSRMENAREERIRREGRRREGGLKSLIENVGDEGIEERAADGARVIEIKY